MIYYYSKFKVNVYKGGDQGI